MSQLVDYLPGVDDADLPKLLVVCDFQNFVVRDLDEGTEWAFTLEQLPGHVELFAFLAGHNQTTAHFVDEQTNLEATKLLATLHDHLAGFNYPQEQLQVFLTRLLCMPSSQTARVCGRAGSSLTT